MTVTVSGKGSGVQFSSHGVSVSLTPEEIGMVGPKTENEALYCYARLVRFGRYVTALAAARNGEFSQDLIPNILAPFDSDVRFFKDLMDKEREAIHVSKG